MTFADIKTAVYEDTGYASSPASAVSTRVARYVNEAVRAILAEPGLQRLADNDSQLQVASVASQARYVVPEAAARIMGINERTNDRALMAMSLEEYRRREPDPTITGTPTHFVPVGRVAVAVQPSDASSLFVDSTSASDTGTAFIEGLVTGGYRRTASVTMTGTTAVNLASTISNWIEVEDFYISANAVGTVTLHEDASGGTELAQITIGQKRPRYYAFYLWPTPAAVVTYYVDYRRELVDLANDTDEPPLPTDFHPMLAKYAAWREWELKDDVQRALQAKQQYDKWLTRLKFYTQSLSSELPVMGRGRRVGHSRLGGEYPADTWTLG
jgi:hypothetical protein